MAEISALKDQLISILNKELPGEAAQQKMASYKRAQPKDLNKQHIKPRLSAVLVNLFYFDGALHCTLIQRPDYDGTHSGQVAFPGGKKEDDDRDLIATALRESQEEVGTKAEDVEIIGALSELYIPPSNFLVSPFIGLSSKAPAYTIDPYEVAEAFHFPLRLLHDPGYFEVKRIFIKHYKTHINAPSFQYEGKTIWGATAMMLSELKEVIPESFL